MPAYKDEKRNTWYCQFYYEDWQGTKRSEAIKPNEKHWRGRTSSTYKIGYRF